MAIRVWMGSPCPMTLLNAYMQLCLFQLMNMSNVPNGHAHYTF